VHLIAWKGLSPNDLLSVECALKDIGKEFQQLVIRRYLEKSIQKKLFCHLQSLQIDYFFNKKAQFVKFTVTVYVIYIYGCDVTHWCHRQ